MEQRMDTSWCTALLQLPASLPAEANEHQPTGPSSLTNTRTEGVQRSAGILSMLSRQINPETDMIDKGLERSLDSKQWTYKKKRIS